MPRITPFLWFDSQAEEAMNFYVSLFKNSRVLSVHRPEGPGTPPLIVSFELDGQRIDGMNAGPQFKFNEAVSFYIDCEDQAEVDRYWNALTANGGEESMCGWARDKFGLWWQIVPKALIEAVTHPDPEKAKRATDAMLQMRKIDVAKIEAALAD